MVLCELHPEALSKLDRVGDTLNGSSLCGPGAEDQPAKLVVVGKHLVDGVVHVVVIFSHVLDNLDLGRWIRVTHLFVSCYDCRCCPGPSILDFFSDFPRHTDRVGDLTQATSGHLSGLPWRVLLFGRVASCLQVRERRTGRS